MAGRESYRTVRDSVARTTNQAAELAEEVERLAAYEAALLGARLRPPSRFHVLDYEEIIQQRLAEIRQRIRAAGRPRLSRDWLRAA